MDLDRNFYIFREGRSQFSASRLLADLREALTRVSDEQSCTDALLRCGELQCALEDAESPRAMMLAAATERCAEALISGKYQLCAAVQDALPHDLAGTVRVSTPEGFAYYALHPRQYAEVVKRLPHIRDAVVIGIRSIGTTLSAMTAAGLRERGARVVRFSVRPEGEPFDRRLEWRPEQLEGVRDGLRRGAVFLVVDEGPGLSGSSFLAVAEALSSAGIPKQRVTLIPSYQPDPAALCAGDGAKRWDQFGCVPVPQCMRPEGDWIGSGEWRARFFGKTDEGWPGVWTSMDRPKFHSSDGRVLWKFEGLGPYGARPRAQATVLSERGFGARVLEDKFGFLGYECVPGSALQAEDLSQAPIEALASYCAFRTENFSSEVTSSQQQELETMLRVNCEREFGDRLPEPFASLEVVAPVVCDGKMLPHEWLRTSQGSFLKLDATCHGDDHFFPGPCDEAWDLAGAIVEWRMNQEARDAFLRRYQALTGHDPSGRIPNYLLAYAIFRMAWSKTAAQAMKGTIDEQLLLREYRKYRAYAERTVSISAHR
jgi:hypothetical protein